MKRFLPLMLLFLAVAPAVAQPGEKTLNRRYQNEIRDSLARVIAERQKTMQRYAEQTLAELPNDEKLYDESFISVGVDLLDTFYEDGSLHLDLIYRLSYNCRHLEGVTDDYPLGAYDADSSNSCRAICGLTRHFLDNDLADVIVGGKDVEMFITSTADGTEIPNVVPYDGRYGEFRYMPVTFNGERLRLSVDHTTGITNNCQLAYIRAQSVREKLENTISVLRQTNNTYRYITRSYKDSLNTHYYRRSSIEMRVSDVFDETVERVRNDKMQDTYVDYNIPVTKAKNPDTYVLIIANEDYGNPLIPNAHYAVNDGEVASQYFVKALGVPQRQVKLLTNASKAVMLQEGVHWLTELAQAVAQKDGDQTTPKANLIIYYAGHGYTDLDGAAYLMPTNINTDGIASLQGAKKGGCKLFGCGKKSSSDSSTYDIVLSKKESARMAKECLSVDELCNMFNGKVVPVKDLTIIFDASFNGFNRDGKAMVRADIQRDPKKKRRKSNMRADAVILLAADYDKTAFSFDDQQHGFLTYFLLKEIKDKKERFLNYTYQEIFDIVGQKINKESALQNKWQEISGLTGGRYKDGWQYMKF